MDIQHHGGVTKEVISKSTKGYNRKFPKTPLKKHKVTICQINDLTKYYNSMQCYLYMLILSVSRRPHSNFCPLPLMLATSSSFLRLFHPRYPLSFSMVCFQVFLGRSYFCFHSEVHIREYFGFFLWSLLHL